MARVGKYYGVHSKDAIKSAWMDAKYTFSKVVKKKS